MQIDHVHFYVENAKDRRDWFVQVMGFDSIASGYNNHTHTEVVGSGKVKFFLSSAINQSGPVADFLRHHPQGVADVAFTVDDLDSVVDKVLANGGKLKKAVTYSTFPQGKLKSCLIHSITGLNHTLIEIPPTLRTSGGNARGYHKEIDHIVLNVAAGELEGVVSWYETVLGFERKQTFTIKTDRSALYSQVMIHPTSGLQFPVNEPLSANSQIQEFLDFNRGAGIQHLALYTPNIAQITKKLRADGLSFLSVPLTYYSQLQQRPCQLTLTQEEWKELIEQEILVDSQNLSYQSDIMPVLLQIFTKPIFGEPTFFFELIERRYQAQGFGEGNFQALFEAIEQEQIKRGII